MVTAGDSDSTKIDEVSNHLSSSVLSVQYWFSVLIQLLLLNMFLPSFYSRFLYMIFCGVIFVDPRLLRSRMYSNKMGEVANLYMGMEF